MDLQKENLLTTYIDFDDLILKLESILLNQISVDYVKLSEFIEQNTWGCFAKYIQNFINYN